jgi:protein-S-isoprenylcysteine O-methyltransferase Ste14
MPDDAAETETAQRRKVEFASTFDRLIASNLSLTGSVGQLTESAGRLVKLSWAIILLNVVLISAGAAAVVWFVLTRQPHQ